MQYGKPWRIRKPDGEVIEVQNLFEFCKKNGLNGAKMLTVMRGKYSQHKDYSKAD